MSASEAGGARSPIGSLARATRHAAQRTAQRTARWARRRPRRTIALLAIAALVYSQCLSPPPWDEPDRIPAPSATTRSFSAGPDVWPAPGADAGATGVTSADPPIDAEIAWTRGFPTAVTAIVADERAVYLVLPEESLVIALAAATGAELWTADLPRRPDHSPALAGDLLYVQMRGTGMVALDAETGAVRWVDQADRGLTATLAVVEGIVWGGKRGQVVALDAETGAPLAAAGIGGSFVQARLAVGPDRVAVAKADALVLLDRATGARTFEARFPDLRHVAAVEGTVVAVSDRQLVAFEGDEGLPWWDGVRDWWFRLHVYIGVPDVPTPANRWVQQVRCDVLAPVLLSDRVIIACGEGIVRAHDLLTGELLWEQDQQPLVASPVMTQSGLLVVERHALVLLDAETGAERARRGLPGARIGDTIVTSAAIYLLTAEDELIALR